MQPRRLCILGVGLLGGSIGLAVRQRISGCQVAGYGHRAATLDEALRLGVLDEAHTDPAAAVRDADLVIVCTPVGSIPSLLKQSAHAFAAGAVVTDVGSTKRSIVEAAEAALPAGVHFVGSHPMAGSEKRGVQFARADLFDRAVCILTPTARTDEAALAKVESFWHVLGMRTTRVDPQEHDRLLADVSHLPHVVAAAMIAMQQDAALGVCGKGFVDATRIAGGDPGLWRDILLDNRENVQNSLQGLREQLLEVERWLNAGDAQSLETWLVRSAQRRQAMLIRRGEGSE